MTYKPCVSVVVCVNRNPTIFKKCLDSLLTQDYPHELYEVILVDSTKNGEGEKLFSDLCKVIRTNSASTGGMFNVGINAAKGEISAFTGADCIVSKNWLSTLVDGFSNNQVAGTGGNIVIDGKACFDLRAVGLADDEGYLLFNKNKLISKGPVRIPNFLGANCAFRKSVMEKEGNYIETLPDVGCEDVELCVRFMLKGYKLKFVDNIVYHPSRTVKSSMINGVRDGKALYFLLKLYRPDLIRSIYYRMAINIIWDKGSLFMLLGYIQEAGKKRAIQEYFTKYKVLSPPKKETVN